MRRLVLVAAACLAAVAAVPTVGLAQDPDEREEEEAAKRKKREEEWGSSKAPLPAMRNAGPCPFVKTLYDAARYVEFKDGREASANVGFTGEIQGVSAGCAYKGEQPIEVAMNVLFEFGRGPQAEGDSKTYRYWVAVTDRDREVLAKRTFELPVRFAPGQDRVYRTETIGQIVIPRGQATTSGANFEVLVGFEVTPQMAAFNRDGKRFRPNVGATVAAQDSSQGR